MTDTTHCINPFAAGNTGKFNRRFEYFNRCKIPRKHDVYTRRLQRFFSQILVRYQARLRLGEVYDRIMIIGYTELKFAQFKNQPSLSLNLTLSEAVQMYCYE